MISFEKKKACTDGRLDSVPVAFKQASAATVVVAAAGYPGSYPKGDIITLPTVNNTG